MDKINESNGNPMDEALKVGQTAFTLSAKAEEAIAGLTQDDRTVFKVIATNEQRLVGWIVIPNGLLRMTDSGNAILGFKGQGGTLLYTVPAEMAYSFRQKRAATRFGQEEFANATPPRKDSGNRGNGKADKWAE